jgi:phosphoribosylformylglycinamidine (FGAM) synthase-like amidotransferase family enzyme
VRIAVYSPDAPLEADDDVVDVVVVVPPGLGAVPAPAALEGLRRFARAGGNVLGLADGVRWLCAAELLPGAVTDADEGAPPTHVRVEGRATAFTWAIPAGRIVALAAAATSARYAATAPELAALAAHGRIVLRYCDASGGVARRGPQDATVAGLSDETGRVVGLFAPSTTTFDCELGRQLGSCFQAPRKPR